MSTEQKFSLEQALLPLEKWMLDNGFDYMTIIYYQNIIKDGLGEMVNALSKAD